MPAPGWLPSLRTARVVAPRQAIAALVGAALLAVLVTAAVLYRARPRATAVPAAPPPVLTSAAHSGTGTRLVVSVVGKVRHPGLVSVPAGSRVADAVRAAGGALPEADLTALNMARRLADGEQIVVGVPVAAVPSGTGGTGASPVNLNAATLDQLDALPGVGPVIAQRIVDWRSAHGPFTSVDQLGEIDGIGARTLEHLRPLVSV